MKVGTDAVLLGSWADVSGAKNILDIGTGCGVIALMLAQRAGNALIDAVEADSSSSEQAAENFNASDFAPRLHSFNRRIQDHEGAYDLIVSNPPFFSKSLLPPAPQRQSARHTETLSFDDLLEAVGRLLKTGGRFAVILPVTEGNSFRSLATRFGFYCNRSLAFFSREGKPQERWLLEFAAERETPVNEKLVLYGGDAWSEEYRKLTAEFYL